LPPSEDLYRCCLHWKVITCDIQETSETLATEYQDVPGFVRVPWGPVIVEAKRNFKRGMAYLNGLAIHTGRKKPKSRSGIRAFGFVERPNRGTQRRR